MSGIPQFCGGLVAGLRPNDGVELDPFRPRSIATAWAPKIF